MIEEIEKIVEGWKNLIFKNPVSEALGKKRLGLCLPCQHYKKDIQRCGVCNCFVPAAVRSSKKTCPKGKW